MMYSANRFDCVQYILDYLKLDYRKPILPQGWYASQNFLIQNLQAYINEDFPLKIKAFIFNPQKLLPDDIVFMRFHGNFCHHLARYVGNQHVEHCLPGRGICRDLLRPRFFVFGVRFYGT